MGGDRAAPGLTFCLAVSPWRELSRHGRLPPEDAGTAALGTEPRPAASHCTTLSTRWVRLPLSPGNSCSRTVPRTILPSVRPRPEAHASWLARPRAPVLSTTATSGRYVLFRSGAPGAATSRSVRAVRYGARVSVRGVRISIYEKVYSEGGEAFEKRLADNLSVLENLRRQGMLSPALGWNIHEVMHHGGL